MYIKYGIYITIHIYIIYTDPYMYTFLLKSPTCEPTDNALWALLDVHLLLVFMQDPVL